MLCYARKGMGEMELRVLKYFLVVAREENITRAAALLHVTQPTLSRQLMQLEEELGESCSAAASIILSSQMTVSFCAAARRRSWIWRKRQSGNSNDRREC